MMWERQVLTVANQQWAEVWVVPVDDGVDHVPDDPDCWCRPTIRWAEGDDEHLPSAMLVHNSSDHRELWERDTRLTFTEH